MKVKSIIISLNVIFLLIILSSCRETSFLVDVTKATVETHQKSNQAEAVAIEYINEKYGDIFKSGGAYYKGNGTWGSDFYIDDKTKFCTVRLFLNKDGKFEVIKPGGIFKPDNCGELILRPKITKYIQDNTVNKFYDKSDVSMGVSLSCVDKEKNCGKGEDIYNSNGYWKLSAKEWLDKFYPYLKVDTIGVSIFNQKESAENIAKAVEMIKNLNNFLYKLIGTHQIESMRIYIYQFSQEEFKKKYNNKFKYTIPKNSSGHKGVDGLLYKYNMWFEYVLQKCKVKGNYFCFNNDSNLSRLKNVADIEKYISLVIEDKKVRKKIEDTKYYQPVKQLLENK
ncbi:hypothetical protein FNFX1_0799 [Francisella cf. novicida Fx1]|uniref:hypothetical protein n=1 Tax=Francisella tularensis TaxID=263 RepID=UPI0002059010|nr:hypothetical protein [Francisella tularensis]AEB27747.1 hypothetical protein FNFX1_0799 [Francisella cf. novicida Fx1]MBK2110175.1 hypothetical protein [Francisella tularensis subsp. novicida FSC595]